MVGSDAVFRPMTGGDTVSKNPFLIKRGKDFVWLGHTKKSESTPSWWHLKGKGKGDPEFSYSLSFLVSLRPEWATQDHMSMKEKLHFCHFCNWRQGKSNGLPHPPSVLVRGKEAFIALQQGYKMKSFCNLMVVQWGKRWGNLGKMSWSLGR